MLLDLQHFQHNNADANRFSLLQTKQPAWQGCIDCTVIDRQIAIVVDNVKLKNVNECKYLGVILDNDLKWTAHIGTIYKKLIKLTEIFYKIQNKLPSAVLKSIQYAFVQPHISYGVELYANTYAVHFDKLTKVTNKIFRILHNKPVLTPTSELYTAYNTLPIAELHRQQILILMQKSLTFRQVTLSVQ